MIIISHRGNTNGPSIDENKPHQAMLVMYAGFHCEVDLWFTEKGYYLGHDMPQYKVEYYFLVNPLLWIHCKNIEAFVNLSHDEHLNLVLHDNGIALTTKGYLWTAPGLLTGEKSIAVMPELSLNWNYKNAYGKCTDFIYG